ncbi:hypothetical protein [Wolbachia endosymbiont of Ctenocephalides felis wCfeJ]|uniref:hypothetical protein n=1 Tax=Wolbachia endosymbiont of Ctenocephalides felis wCfeJ TaxID=2732594 RepID=UPI001445E860|nr:hypothetical protein [Wolbachia endosymbiont of Ctenocephalides felis wCfeJ]
MARNFYVSIQRHIEVKVMSFQRMTLESTTLSFQRLTLEPSLIFIFTQNRK